MNAHRASDTPVTTADPYHGGVRLVGLLATSACALLGCTAPPTDDLAALEAELRANQQALVALVAELDSHEALAWYQLRWIEGLEEAGSANLWETMRTLRSRPRPTLGRAAFDDVSQDNRLVAAVPDGASRRGLITYYAQLDELASPALAEYRALAEHHDEVLGPGEWRNMFDLDVGEDVLPVDFRTALTELVADDHASRLRGLIRAIDAYRREVFAASDATQSLLATLFAPPA